MNYLCHLKRKDKAASQDVDSSLLSYLSTEPLDEPAPGSFHVPSPPVFHAPTDKSRQHTSLVPTGLLRYPTLAPSSGCRLPSSKELLGSQHSQHQSGSVSCLLLSPRGSDYQMGHCLSGPLFCYGNSLMRG